MTLSCASEVRLFEVQIMRKPAGVEQSSIHAGVTTSHPMTAAELKLLYRGEEPMSGVPLPFSDRNPSETQNSFPVAARLPPLCP